MGCCGEKRQSTKSSKRSASIGWASGAKRQAAAKQAPEPPRATPRRAQ